MSVPSTAPGGVAPPSEKGWLERALSPIADVHEGEAAAALLMMVTMFLVLAGYYLLKTAREAFILGEGGAEVKSYSSAGQAVLLLILVPAYGAFASRVNRLQLVQWVTLFFASNLLIFLALLAVHVRIGIAFFLWLGIFNVMVIAQFWAFAADVFSEEQGKRLFPLVGLGSSLGAWLGSVRAGAILQTAGPARLLASGAAILVLCVGLVRVINRAAERSAPPDRSADAAKKVAGGPNGFRMILSDPYLGLIAALVLLLNVVNTSGEYLFGRYVVNAAASMYGTGPETAALRQQFIGATYSSFFSYVNLVGLLLQMFVVSRVFKYLGLGRALLIHPVVALVGYVAMIRAPSFELIRALKIADNAVDYSISNTARQALWLPTSRAARYKAKQAVDSFCVRAGDVLQAGVVYSGELASFTTTAFAALNVVWVIGWLAVVLGLGRRLRESPPTPPVRR